MPSASSPSRVSLATTAIPFDSSGSRLQVHQRTALFTRIQAWSRLSRALMGGTRGMWAMGEEYLPKFPDEVQATWEARLKQSFLYNGYKLAHGVMVGKAFSHPIVLQPDVPLKFHDWAENIDLRGNHLDIFAQDVFGDSLHSGRGYILVEFPSRPSTIRGRVVASQEKQFNLRPYFSYVCADKDMRSIDERVVNGQTVVERIRFHKCTVERSGWDQEEVERIYVYELTSEGVRYQVHRKPDGETKPGEDWPIETIKDSNGSGRPSTGFVLGFDGSPLRRIPIAKFEVQEDGPFLEDLAFKNLEHYQSSSDQRNVLHVKRAIGIKVYGVDKEKFLEQKIPWGPGAMYFLPHPKSESDMEFLVHESDIDIGERDIAHIEEQMVTLSLEPLLNRPGSLTATAKALDQARANSRLLAAVRRFEDCLEMAMEFACVDFGGEPTGGSIKMNEDFGISIMHDEELRTLVELRLPKQRGQRPQISHVTLLVELKRRGVLMDDTDPNEEIKRIIKESEAIEGGRPEIQRSGDNPDRDSDGSLEDDSEQED